MYLLSPSLKLSPAPQATCLGQAEKGGRCSGTAETSGPSDMVSVDTSNCFSKNMNEKFKVSLLGGSDGWCAFGELRVSERVHTGHFIPTFTSMIRGLVGELQYK